MFVVTARSGASSPQSVSLVVPLTRSEATTRPTVSSLVRTLADSPFDYELLFVTHGRASEARRAIEQLVLSNPLRYRQVHVADEHEADRGVMEALVRARGRTIIVLEDADSAAVRSLTALLGTLSTGDERDAA